MQRFGMREKDLDVTLAESDRERIDVEFRGTSNVPPAKKSVAARKIVILLCDEEKKMMDECAPEQMEQEEARGDVGKGSKCIRLHNICLSRTSIQNHPQMLPTHHLPPSPHLFLPSPQSNLRRNLSWNRRNHLPNQVSHPRFSAKR